MRRRSRFYLWRRTEANILSIRYKIALMLARCDRNGRRPHRDELSSLDWEIRRLRLNLRQLAHG